MLHHLIGRELKGTRLPEQAEISIIKGMIENEKIDNICQYTGDWEFHLVSLSIEDIVTVIRHCTDICQHIQSYFQYNNRDVGTSYQKFMRCVAEKENGNQDGNHGEDNDLSFLFLRYRYLGFELICQAFRLVAEKLLDGQLENATGNIFMVSLNVHAVNPIVQLVQERNRLMIDFISDYMRISAATETKPIDFSVGHSIAQIVKNMRRIEASCELNTTLPEEDFDRVYRVMISRVSGAVAHYLKIWDLICDQEYDLAAIERDKLPEGSVAQDLDLSFCHYMLAMQIPDQRSYGLAGLQQLSDVGYARASYQLGLSYQMDAQNAHVKDSISPTGALAEYYFRKAVLQGDHFFTQFSSLAQLIASSCPLLTQVQEKILEQLAWIYGGGETHLQLRSFCQQRFLLLVDNMVESVMRGDMILPPDYTEKTLRCQIADLLRTVDSSPFMHNLNAPLLQNMLGDISPYIWNFLKNITAAQLESYQLLNKIVYGELIESYYCQPSAPSLFSSFRRK